MIHFAREDEATRMSSAPSSTRASLAPGPEGDFVLGHYRTMRADPLGFFLYLQRTFGDISRFRLGDLVAHLICHPDEVRAVLQDDGKRFSKDSRGYRKLKLVIGEGLLTSEGSFWRRQRRIAQPAFHRERITALGNVIVGGAEELVQRWDRLLAHGAPIDVALEMARTALRIAGEAFMGADVRGEAEGIREALECAAHDTFARMMTPFDLPLFVPTPRNVRLRRAIAKLDSVVFKMIAERRERGSHDKNDLLSMLMEARDEETGEKMSDRQLRDEAMTMLLAGHETTANALTWAWHLLSRAPEAERKLHAELRSVLGGRSPTAADIPNLVYCRMVIEESMRLYPPAWVVGRAPIHDERIGGVEMPAGSVVFVSPYVTHRHPAFWPEPERFDPGRFAPAHAAERDRGAYIPFGGGPRACIGQAFAMTEMQLVLATLAQRFELRTAKGREAIPEPLVTIRAKGGLWMTISRRHPAEVAPMSDVAV
jgi:cytochrome P450